MSRAGVVFPIFVKSVMIKAMADQFRFLVRDEDAGQRLDRFLAMVLADAQMTRSRLQALILDGHVLVEGTRKKVGYLVRSGEQVVVEVPPPQVSTLAAQEVPFIILYEDDALVVLSKPPGVVVHPACGHLEGTLVHGLLFRCANLSGINGQLRPGIVHRLDKDTSGCMVVAKDDQAHHRLVEQFKSRQIVKIYHAILVGSPEKGHGTVDLPIGRHPVNRKKMAVRPENGRPAITHWRTVERFGAGCTFVELRLETGRTHQIRVHMAALGHPVAGDPVYGGKVKELSRFGIVRQCLHSSTLGFCHPRTGKAMEFTAPLWADLAAALDCLRDADQAMPSHRVPCL